MIRNKVGVGGPIVIDLTGPAGNAYSLLALAGQLARQLDLDEDAIRSEMMSGDYQNLIAVFDRHFGDRVILEI